MQPKADHTAWTLVLCRRREKSDPLVVEDLIRYSTKEAAEAELAAVQARGTPAYLLPPVEAWGGKY
jgi:hypothetical protein